MRAKVMPSTRLQQFKQRTKQDGIQLRAKLCAEPVDNTLKTLPFL